MAMRLRPGQAAAPASPAAPVAGSRSAGREIADPCLLAMDDPKKAVAPPPTVVDYWTISHTKPRQPSPSGIDGWVLRSLEGVVRRRSGPVLDTIVRLTVAEQWDATLEQILREADVITEKREFKS